LKLQYQTLEGLKEFIVSYIVKPEVIKVRIEYNSDLFEAQVKRKLNAIAHSPSAVTLGRVKSIHFLETLAVSVF